MSQHAVKKVKCKMLAIHLVKVKIKKTYSNRIAHLQLRHYNFFALSYFLMLENLISALDGSDKSCGNGTKCSSVCDSVVSVPCLGIKE